MHHQSQKLVMEVEAAQQMYTPRYFLLPILSTTIPSVNATSLARKKCPINCFFFLIFLLAEGQSGWFKEAATGWDAETSRRREPSDDDEGATGVSAERLQRGVVS